MENFPWGKVLKVHQIGTHTVTEYVVGPQWVDAGKIEFHTCDCSTDSLDTAILQSICSKYKEPDAMMYITRLLNMKPGD